MAYKNFFQGSQYEFVDEPEGCQSNWLNAILCEDKAERDNFFETTNNAGVMTRPAWQPMHSLDIFSNCLSGPMSVTEMIANRLVNIPSSPKSAIKKGLVRGLIDLKMENHDLIFVGRRDIKRSVIDVIESLGHHSIEGIYWPG